MRETQNPQSWQRRILDRVSIVLAVLGVFLVLAFQRIPGVGDPPPFLALPFYAAVAVVWLAALWRGAGFHARAGLVVSALIVALAVGLFRVGYTSGVSLVALAAVLLARLHRSHRSVI